MLAITLCLTDIRLVPSWHLMIEFNSRRLAKAAGCTFGKTRFIAGDNVDTALKAAPPTRANVQGTRFIHNKSDKALSCLQRLLLGIADECARI